MTGPTLYNDDLDEDCYRVRLLAACIGAKLTLQGVNAYPGRAHLREPLVTLNPAGRLPILTDGPLTLTHTTAILLHLAASRDAARRFLPADPLAQARMHDWLAFAALDLAPAARARQISLQDDPARAAADVQAARSALRRMEDHMTRQTLAGEGFFAGPALTLADLALFPGFALSRDAGIAHDTFPALRLWARRVRAVPGFITMPGIPDYH
jgi:glutathione S-transferase